MLPLLPPPSTAQGHHRRAEAVEERNSGVPQRFAHGLRGGFGGGHGEEQSELVTLPGRLDQRLGRGNPQFDFRIGH